MKQEQREKLVIRSEKPGFKSPSCGKRQFEVNACVDAESRSMKLYGSGIFCADHRCLSELFCEGTRQYGVPGNENEECIFCTLVL